MDLTSYAELAVRLVNSAAGVDSETDQLGTTGAFRAFVGDYPLLRGPWTHHDLDALRMLRTELTDVFVAAAQRDHAIAAERLNALLVQYPIRPTLVRHDRSRWHLHLDESGSLSDRYAAGAIAGAAAVASRCGMSHLGICKLPDCRCVFIDASAGRASLCCTKHCGSKASVTTLPSHRRSANGFSAAG